MTNAGTLEHELEVFGPGGDVLGEVGPTAAGEDGDVVLDLEQAGTYRYVCGIDDHEQQGMAGTFEVS
jgi:plastocyanin